MKIRHPILLKTSRFVGAWFLRIWMATIRYRYRPQGATLEPGSEELPGRCLYALWHENMLLPSYLYSQGGVTILISQHADGQILAEVCRHLGISAVRGSTTRGGVEALRQLLRIGRTNHLAITPDGPRGPWRQVQPGLIYLAARTGLPVVPIGFGYRRAWRFRSWDRMVLPKPWSRAVGVTGTPIAVPFDLDKQQLEHYRQRIEQELLQLTEAAEKLTR